MRNALSNLLDRVVLGESPTRRLWFARRMPDRYVRNTQKLDFRTTVRWVASRSAFYRRKFQEHRIDPAMVRRPADLGNIFTTSTDLLTHPVEDFLIEASKIPPAEFYDRAVDYRFNVMVVEPSWIVSLTEIAEKRGTWPVKLMLVGGENMSEKSRRHVEEIWKTDLYLTYGQTESFGSAGTECNRKNGYHLQELKFWFEIPEPDDQGHGEIVFTTLSRRVMPLLRYRTSDVARFMEGVCDCNLKALRRISKIVGRCDEMVNCGLGNISPWMFERVLENVSGLAHDWQVLVTRPDLRDAIEIKVELLEGASQDKVERAIRMSLADLFPDMARNVSMGLCEMNVASAARGTLRTGRKLRSIVDLRKTLFRAEAAIPSASTV